MTMSLTPGERISLIRESATLLDKQEWGILDLILQQHRMPVTDPWSGTKAAYVVEMIRDAEDDRLKQLHTYLTSETAGERIADHSPWTSSRLRLFCSHLAEYRSHVGEVGDALSRFGIESFIAHDAIEPSKEWAQVLEGALASCDAMVVFLHPGLRESGWCGQEVGWVMGRKRPVLPLNYGLAPYGFIEKLQYQTCSNMDPQKIALVIVDWLTKTPSVHARLASGLVDSFAFSPSWNFTRSIAPFLERINTVSDDDLGKMEAAARDNVDVRECMITPAMRGPAWVRDYVSARRGQEAESSASTTSSF
jgi:hypothetical protein